MYDPPSVPFVPVQVLVMLYIPQSVEGKGLASQDGCRTGIYKVVTKEYGMKANERGAVISAAFVA